MDGTHGVADGHARGVGFVLLIDSAFRSKVGNFDFLLMHFRLFIAVVSGIPLPGTKVRQDEEMLFGSTNNVVEGHGLF